MNNNYNPFNNNSDLDNNQILNHDQNNVNRKDVSYVVADANKVKRQENVSKIALFSVYAMFFVVAGIVFYMYQYSNQNKEESIFVEESSYQVEKIELNETNIVLQKGSSAELITKITPSDATNSELSFSSSNSSVAIVDKNGKITAKESGSAIITVRSTNGKMAKCEVIVETYKIEVSEIILNLNNKTMTIGEKFQLVATINPSNATEKNLNWISSNSSVVTVDNNGIIKAIGKGSATITVKTSNGKMADCTINVKSKDVENVELNPKSIVIKKGETTKLITIITPTDADVGTLSYISSNSDIASVDSEGNVTAKNVGSTTVTVKTSNGKSSTCNIKVETKTVAVSGIILNSNNKVMTIGEKSQLVATISPSNATERNLNWTSSNSSVVTVDNNGVIKAIGKGSATITVKTSNGKMASCVINVKSKDVEKIELNPQNLVLQKGSTAKLTTIITPTDAEVGTISYISSNTSIATVDGNGVVTAKAKGNVTITAKTSNGKEANCKITVEEPIIEATSVSLKTTSQKMKVGEQIQLLATISPSNVTDRTLVWTSNNTGVVSVDGNGKITAKKEGSATIIVSSKNGKKASCNVVVEKNEVAVTGIKLNETNINMKVGNTKTLVATITPNNATNKTITWSSSNTGVVSVNSNGQLTAKKSGTAVITAKTANGKTAFCNIKVEADNIYKVTLNSQNSTTSGTQEVWYQLNATKSIGGVVCYYYTDSNLSNCLKNQTIIKPAKNNYIFKGYYTEPNGRGTMYINENGVFINNLYKNISSNITLYAYWDAGTFSIPLQTTDGSTLSGGDPYVIYKNGYYYYLATRGYDIKISVSKNLQDIGKPERTVTVWKNTSGHVIWAPELHYIQGKWYIYYTDVQGSNDDTDRRSYVLRAKTSDPLGAYEYMGEIYDSNHHYYAIDGTVLEWGGELYYIYSGRVDEYGIRNLYIARMSNPWTLSTERNLISTPTYSWEATINEGPQILIKNNTLRIIYSANGAQTTTYCLGMLTYNGTGSLLSQSSWTKSQNPVFQSANGIYGPGHASFTTSRDGTESWIVYHAFPNADSSTLSSWKRYVYIKKITWNGTTPVFGEPLSAGTKQKVPSGSV